MITVLMLMIIQMILVMMAMVVMMIKIYDMPLGVADILWLPE